MKHYSPAGRRNHSRALKRLLDTWDRNGSTSMPNCMTDIWWWWWWRWYWDRGLSGTAETAVPIYKTCDRESKNTFFFVAEKEFKTPRKSRCHRSIELC
jgi:hypothetical protein